MVDSEVNTKMKTNRMIAVMGIVIMLALQITMVSAYETRATMSALNLWDLFVEYTFGSFFITVVALCILFGIMLMMGGISPVTSMMFMGAFLVAMSIGYGYTIIAVPIVVIAILTFVYQAMRLYTEMT